MFNCSCAWMMLYELWTEAISVVEYLFWTKNSIQHLWIWRDLVTNVLYDGLCRVFLIELAVVILQRRKSWGVYTFTRQAVISLKPNDTCKKRSSVWPSNMLKTVHQEYHSVAQLVRFRFKILLSLTAHKRKLLQGNLFLLLVCSHEVPLCLCSIFCSGSLVQVSTASYRVWSMEHAPNCIP